MVECQSSISANVRCGLESLLPPVFCLEDAWVVEDCRRPLVGVLMEGRETLLV